jgi:signal transduction histidine kinase
LRARRRQYQMRDKLEQLGSTQQALMQSEKLAVTGRLAASIAHEINNPLEAVTNLLYLARTNPAVADREYYLLEAEKELARVSHITNQTLMFNRQVSGPSATDVAAVLNSVLSLYQGRLRNSNVVIEKDFEEIPTLTASGGELRQLFANLIGNSLDAMRGGGKLTLRLRNTRNNSGTPKGIRVVIADSGYGIPPAIKSRVFEPFVSTKGNTGTGLGLWLGLEIVNKHGGSIRLRSRTTAPTGTVISISLPLANCAVDKVAV